MFNSDENKTFKTVYLLRVNYNIMYKMMRIQHSLFPPDKTHNFAKAFDEFLILWFKFE